MNNTQNYKIFIIKCDIDNNIIARQAATKQKKIEINF